MSQQKIVLSGIRPTGPLQFANYWGAIRQFVELDEDPNALCLYFGADLHAFTTLDDAEAVEQYLLEIVYDYLAFGISPEKHGSIIYAQSNVPDVLRLFWLFCCLSPNGVLRRMPSYKEKIDVGTMSGEQPVDNLGLYAYPPLMAADIGAPRATHVPVGDDQIPHLEFTRELLARFNRIAADRGEAEVLFPIPQSITTAVVPGLSLQREDGTFPKMSKSLGNAVLLSDDPKRVTERILRAPTDPARVKRTDRGTPERCCIYALHNMVSSPDEARECANGCRTAGIGCTDCKGVLARNITSILAPFQERRAELARDKDLARDVLIEGGKRAREIIAPTVERASRIMGLPRIEGG